MKRHEKNKSKVVNYVESKQNNVTHHNSHNTSNTNYSKYNNTNYIQQNIVINNFGKENIKHIKSKFMDRLIKIPYGAIPKLLKAIHFDPKHPENRNVRITNKKQPYANIYKNDKWIIADRKAIISDMIDKGFDMIQEHHEENTQKLNGYKLKNYTRFIDQFEEDDRLLKQKLEKNIEIEILNNS